MIYKQSNSRVISSYPAQVETMIESAMVLTDLETAYDFHSDQGSDANYSDDKSKILIADNQQLIYGHNIDGQKFLIDSRIGRQNSKPTKMSEFFEPISSENDFDDHLVVPRAYMHVADLQKKELNTYTFLKNVDKSSKFLGGVAIMGRHFTHRKQSESKLQEKINGSYEKASHAKILDKSAVRKLTALLPNYEVIT